MATEIRYRDNDGVYRRVYPRSMAELEQRLRWLRARRSEAAVYRDQHQVGAVLPDRVTPGNWVWWCDGDLFDEAS